MNSTTSPKKKSPSSKAQRKAGRVTPCAPPSPSRGTARRGLTRPASLRRELRAWLHTELPTQFERDTMLTPEWIAECVVSEVERFLNADLPENFAERLAARAYYLYPRSKHFHKGMNRPGNRGRENLLMFMRHWTAGWLKRAGNPLHKKLPWSFGNGQRLPL